MDIVETLNRLIPSDQLDDPPVVGQNLESEAGNEFRAGNQPEDSLKNMLSDKDPMFGCASSQFNLLDNEDPAFNIVGSAEPDSGGTSAEVSSEEKNSNMSQVKFYSEKTHPRNFKHLHRGDHSSKMPTNSLIRGRPRRKPSHWLTKSFLIEKGVKGTQLKKDLTLGGRVNVQDLEGGLWLNPTVVLRRLTVTIGGFKIELLPGPCYAGDVETNQSGSLDESLYQADIGLLPDAVANQQNPLQESVMEIETPADDATLGLGPYVNPNEVQASNGSFLGNQTTTEIKHEDDNVVEEQKPSSRSQRDVNQPHSSHNHTNDAGNKIDGKVKQLALPKTPPTVKPGRALNKSKDLSSCHKSSMVKDHKEIQSKPSKNIETDQQKMKSPKHKQNVPTLKRPMEVIPTDHMTKMTKLQGPSEVKTLPKSPVSPTKKINLAGHRSGDHQGPAKPSASLYSHKVEAPHHTHSHPPNSSKSHQEAEHHKVKKLEKLQKQRSRNSRSISVEEPQLFVPDNAPAVKKEAAEEPPANESVWDGNNCCGLCKKHHNNMFMVGCGRCDDWFHGDCVGLDLAKVREMEEEDQMYVCLKCCEEESKKVDPEPQPTVQHESQEKNQDAERRPSTGAKEAAHKLGGAPKHETKGKPVSLSSKKPVSVEAIRRSVRDSLREILTHRLKESNLQVSVERALEVAKKTERELFHLFKDTDHKYKSKYRSLIFNLKDTKNNVLFKRVLKGDISPANLIRMSPEELASKELAAWRQRENRHTIEMIEKDQREVERRPITKITHKGEIEIESQEPSKVPEPAEPELPPDLPEILTEVPNSPEKKAEQIKKDTTSQHKSHLFDLHCKICTGRIVPPVEEGPSKAAKVATTVVHRQSTKSEEVTSSAPPIADENLHLSVLEESLRSAKAGLEPRLIHTGREEEASFLSSLKSLWRGFIHMHAVAKLVTKAFPVSGVLDNLTEDLPDSIQVGGRISPQTVWDYLEKIRATGTKEVCLVRFTPETEEDEISYTLLYAYFSSRKRFGVVSNNLKQVKDMYLIPLGGTEKVPHQLVPFDGPGLESNRSNILLGLIIRQRAKRDFPPPEESVRMIPEVKPLPVSTKSTRNTEEEEKQFLSTLMPAHNKDQDKPLAATAEESVVEPFEEPLVPEEPGKQESLKPLRFLPGVLLGWGGELPLLPDVGEKAALAGSDMEKIQPAPKSDISALSSKAPTAAATRFVIKKKEAKSVKSEPSPSSQTSPIAPCSSSEKGAGSVNQQTAVTLKDKPPDVSTEAFLTSLSAAAGVMESRKTECETPEDSLAATQAAVDQTNNSKPPLSGILKKVIAQPMNEDKMSVLDQTKASPPKLLSPKPICVSTTKSEAMLPFHQGYLQLSQAKLNQTPPPSFLSKKSDTVTDQPGAEQTPNSTKAQENTNETEFQHISAAAHTVSLQDSSSSASSQEQLHTSGDNSAVSPSDSGSTTHADEQQPQVRTLMKDYKNPYERYTDPWERAHNSEDRDHHGRHSHHSKKSRHHDRERRHDSSHDDKYKERSRHHDRERRKERHHGDEHSSRHKDRHHHRRESDYENGRRSYS